jgi:N-acetylornithine carbamoyltransferase
VKEKLGGFKGKKFVMSWAYSPSIEKPMAVPQSAVIAATLVGMDVVQVQPKGFDLDTEVIKACKRNARNAGGSFEVMYDMEKAFEDADVVYPKSWTVLENLPPFSKKLNLASTKRAFARNKSWICDKAKLKKAKKDVLYMHCLPCDRGFEVTDDVVDGPNSVVFDQAENRLHVQKAVMALTMR